jgi:hypothetical protein
VAQAISAVIQIAQLTSPEQLGVPASQVSGLGLTVDSGLTPIFWVYCAFVGTVILLCVWMLVAHGPAVPNQVLSAAAPSPGGIGVSAAAAPGPSSADAATTTAPWTGGSPGGQASSWDRPAS